MSETGGGPIDYTVALGRARDLLAGRDRVLLGITGSPGVGKTRLAERLVADLNGEHPAVASHVPMDGFHLADATLRRLGRLDRKGAIDTFDGWGYLNVLRRLREDEHAPVYAPDFDRRLGQPVAASIEVLPSVRIVVSEGNYLLAGDEPWVHLRDLFTEVWFATASEELRMKRLIERHIRFGRSRADSETWARTVDGANAAKIESTRARATIEVATD